MRRAEWRAAAWGLGIVAVLSAGVGLALMYVDPLVHGYLGAGLAGLGLVLLTVGSFAWARSELDESPPTPPAPPSLADGGTVDLVHLLAEQSRRDPQFRAGIEDATRQYLRRRR